MKGRVLFDTSETRKRDQTRAQVEVETGPLSEAHFRAICGLIRCAIAGAAAVAVVIVAGKPGLALDGAALFFAWIYKIMQE